MADKRLAFIDLETSGLEPSSGSVILSIGGVVDKKTKKNPVSEFYIEIQPTEAQWLAASPEALKVNGLTYDGLMKNGVPFSEAVAQFSGWLYENGIVAGKAFVVGQNPSFDMKFLWYYMRDELDFINYPTAEDDVRDIRELYSILVNRRQAPFLKYRSGKNISLALGVEPEPDVHNALEGARVVRRNYEKLMSLLNPQPEQV